MNFFFAHSLVVISIHQCCSTSGVSETFPLSLKLRTIYDQKMSGKMLDVHYFLSITNRMYDVKSTEMW